MTDLTNIVGFTVLVDEEKGISFGDQNYSERCPIALNEISSILLNKYLKYPETVYNFHPNLRVSKCEDCEFSYNMFHIPYGLLGVEFIKTHVFYSEHTDDKYDALIEVHSGNVAVIIQRNGEKEDEWDLNTYVDELKVIHLSKGQKLAIPSGVFYTFANTGLKSAVISMITTNSHRKVDYDTFKREKGLACFIISKNSKVAVVANPKYKINTKLESSSLDKFSKNEDFRDIFVKPFVEINTPLINFMDRVDLLKQYIYK